MLEDYFNILTEEEKIMLDGLLYKLAVSGCKQYNTSVAKLIFTNSTPMHVDHIQQDSNPYSGVSFEYNGHTWGMCARDGGVEILMDSELKAFVSPDKSFIYPIHLQPILVPQSTLEASEEEKVDNQKLCKPCR